MLKRLLALLALLAPQPAAAQTAQNGCQPGGVVNLYCSNSGAFGAPLPDYSVVIDTTGFLTGAQYYRTPAVTTNDITVASTTTRSTVALAADSTGKLTNFAVNAPRLTDLGYFIESSRTNPVKWSTDFSNAAWVKTGLTAAKDLAGPDAVASSASTLTCSGAGTATAVQSLTGQTAGTRTGDLYMRVVAGAPTVALSVDGTTFESQTVTGSWAQAATTAIALGTAFSPTVRITCASASDKVGVFGFNAEISAVPTTPIVTTNVSVTRQLDLTIFSDATALFDSPQLTLVVWTRPLYPTLVTGTFADIDATVAGVPALADRLTSNWRLLNPGTGLPDYHSGMTIGYGGSVAGYDPQDTCCTMATNGPIHAFGFTIDRAANRVAVSLDGSPVSESTNVTNWPAAGMSVLLLGRHATGVPLNGYVMGVIVKPSAISNVDLQELTGSHLTP